jgi:Acetoacetate decarboxylase (ADC)
MISALPRPSVTATEAVWPSDQVKEKIAVRGSPFFEGVSQMDAVLDGEVVKLPIFYYEGSAISAIFPARLNALRELMPDRRFCPARLAPGVGTVAVTCFEYRDTDIGAYNELAISVPLNEPSSAANVPGRALLRSLRRRQLHAWVQHLPVTTEIARLGGVELYNYPKFIAGIHFEQTDRSRDCRLSEGREHILTLSGSLIATPRAERFQLFSHLWMDQQPQGSEFKINAIGMGVSLNRGAAKLELGTRHPIARELRSLLYSQRPIQYQYLPRFEGILYGPEHLTLPLIQSIAAHTGASEPAPVA